MHERTKAEAEVVRESNSTDPDGLAGQFPMDGVFAGYRAHPVRRTGGQDGR